jgi:hypothetical protein
MMLLVGGEWNDGRLCMVNGQWEVLPRGRGPDYTRRFLE